MTVVVLWCQCDSLGATMFFRFLFSEIRDAVLEYMSFDVMSGA